MVDETIDTEFTEKEQTVEDEINDEKSKFDERKDETKEKIDETREKTKILLIMLLTTYTKASMNSEKALKTCKNLQIKNILTTKKQPYNLLTLI